MPVGESFQGRGPRLAFLWLIFASIGLLGALWLWRLWSRGSAGLEPDAVMRPVTARGDLTAMEKTTIAIFRQNSPSVVHITTLVNAATGIFSLDVQQVPEGTGSGFAIPVDKVNRVVTELIRHGKIIRPSLGIEPAPDQWVAELGLKGVLVLGVVPDGPAAKAGIRSTRRTPDGQIELGDLILAIDGQTVESADDLLSAQEKYNVGDTVTVTLARDGQRREVKVTLAAAQ